MRVLCKFCCSLQTLVLERLSFPLESCLRGLIRPLPGNADNISNGW
jgi:hypothetical protein